jgi:hypothetical protein
MTTAVVIRPMDTRHTHGDGAAIVPALPSAIRGKDIGVARAITRRSIMLVAEADSMAAEAASMVEATVAAVTAVAVIVEPMRSPSR